MSKTPRNLKSFQPFLTLYIYILSFYLLFILCCGIDGCNCGGEIQKSEILNVKKERKIKRSRVAQEWTNQV